MYPFFKNNNGFHMAFFCLLLVPLTRPTMNKVFMGLPGLITIVQNPKP